MVRIAIRTLAILVGFSAIVVGWTGEASAFHLAKDRRKVVVVERPVYPPHYYRHGPPRHRYWHRDHWRRWKHRRHDHPSPPPPWAPAWGRRR